MMFDLMDTTNERAIIQVFGMGKIGQKLCHYLENKGIEGVDYFTEIAAQHSNLIPINTTSSNLALAIAIDQGCSNQPVEASDLNFYLVDESDLSSQIEEIQRYVEQTCLNCLVILNHNSVMETGSEKVKNGIKQMDSFLPLPFSPYHGNEVPYLTNQNEMAYRFVKGISEIITRPGLICADFADVRTVLFKNGRTVMETQSAMGENRAINAVGSVISSPQFKKNILSEAKSILVNITAGLDMSISDFEEVGDSIKAVVADNATVVVAAPIDPNMNGEMRVTVIATGLNKPNVVIES
jgi:cell division protein FtsZ